MVRKIRANGEESNPGCVVLPRVSRRTRAMHGLTKIINSVILSVISVISVVNQFVEINNRNIIAIKSAIHFSGL